MRRTLVAFAALLAGCQSYAVPPLLHSPPPPVVGLHAGPDVRVAGRVGVNGTEGLVAASTPAGVGGYVRGLVLERDGSTTSTASQREVEVGLTLFRPGAGAFRPELGVGLARGAVGGVGLDAGVRECEALFDCTYDRADYRAEGTLQREHVQLTLASAGRRGAVGVTGRVSRVCVTDVASSRGGALPDARSTFVGVGILARAGLGPVGLEVTVGTERPLGGGVDPGDGGPERTLGGRYRSTPGYASVGLSLGLEALLGDG